MSRVTVLVAAYNAQEYLEECLDSLVNQTLRDIQIVCIDDASTDQTPRILERYAAKDGRIRVLECSTNSGQAIARNKGIDVADGDYITMLDADDILSADALEKAVSVLDSDAGTGSVLFRLVYFDQKEKLPYPMRSDKDEWDGEEAFRLSLDWSIHGLYVSRTGLFKRFPYDTSCRLYSDDNTTRMHFLNSGKVKSCDGIYYYRQHADSMTNRISDHRLDLIEANTSMAHRLRESGQDRDVLALFEKERWINLTGICGLWLRNRRILNRTDAMDRFLAAWNDIDKSLLPKGLKKKLGYIPCRSFRLYFLQVEFYFLLRRLLGK